MSVGRNPPLWKQLADAAGDGEDSLKVVVLAGECDSKYIKIGKQLAETASSDLYAISNTGHALHLQDPATVASILYHFCEQRVQRSA